MTEEFKTERAACEPAPGEWHGGMSWGGYVGVWADDDYLVHATRPSPECLATVAVMAAGKDLLAACEAIHDRLDYLQGLWGAEGVTQSQIQTLKAAIEKARTIKMFDFDREDDE